MAPQTPAQKRYNARLLAEGLCPGHPASAVAPGYGQCAKCVARHKAWYHKNKTRMLARFRRRQALILKKGECPSHPGTKLIPGWKECRRCGEYARGLWALLTLLTYESLGGRCACTCGCNESNPVHLTLGHVKGDGHKHRREASGRQIMQWILDNPGQTRIRLECYGCNCAKERNGGVCPGFIKSKKYDALVVRVKAIMAILSRRSEGKRTA